MLYLLLNFVIIFLSQGSTIVTLSTLYKHTEYIVTDKGVYISGGLFSYTCNMKPFAEMTRVNIHRGIIAQIVGVGDIVLTCNNVADIKDYREVFELIKNLQEDILYRRDVSE